MRGFAHEAPAATWSGRWIVPSGLGSNASRARVDWAASVWKIRFGAGLARSRRRRARVHAAFVKSPPLSKALPTCRRPGGAQVRAYRDRPLPVPQVRNSLAGRADIGHDPLIIRRGVTGGDKRRENQKCEQRG